MEVGNVLCAGVKELSRLGCEKGQIKEERGV